MSFKDAQAGIEKRFKDNWGSITKVKYENADWKDPEDDDAYVALTVVEVPGSKIELRPNALTRYSGTIILQVFVEEGKGTGRTTELTDAFAGIFRLAEFRFANSGLIRCRVPSGKQPIGPTGSWYQTNARCDYIRDTFQTRAN